MDQNLDKKKPSLWDVDETESFLATLKELQVINLMDGKKFKTSEIFKKVEDKIKAKGYTRTHSQLLEKFRAMKKRYMTAARALSISGAGTEAKVACPYFDELNELFGHRPAMNLSGVDSTILPLDSDQETSGYCASDAEISHVTSKGCDGVQKQKSVRYASRCSSLSPSTSSFDQSSSFDDVESQSLSVSPTFSYSSEDRSSTSTPLVDSQELHGSKKLYASSSKKPKTSKGTYSKREGPRSGLKNIMHDFAEKIIESQEKLLSQTLEEQRKFDKEMLDQYNHIFSQQTQMLLTGLQKLSCPVPTNYATFQQFPVVSTLPPTNPMGFTETPLCRPYPPPVIPRENDNILPSTSTQHDAHRYSKPHQREKEIHRSAIPSRNSVHPETLSYQPLPEKSTNLPSKNKNTCQPATVPRDEVLSRLMLEVDVDNSGIEYEDIEYLDSARIV